MFRTETIIALRAYTTLSTGIQGQITKTNGKYDVVHDIERNSNIKSVLKKLPEISRCVRVATFHNDVMDPGKVKKGPFVLKGVAIRAQERIFGVFSVSSASKKKIIKNKKSLISYKPADVLSSSENKNIIFCTIPVLDGLLPSWDSIRVVADGTVPSLLVVCCNGCFFLRKVATDVPIDIGQGESIYQTLINYNLVSTVKNNDKKNMTIYRLAKNALLLAPENYDKELMQLQSRLQINFTSSDSSTLPAADGKFSVRCKVADEERAAGKVTYQDLNQNFSELLDTEVQSMFDWELPKQRLCLEIEIDNETPVSKISYTIPKEHAGGQNMDIRVDINKPAFREAATGENNEVLTARLEMIIVKLLNQQLNILSLSKSQEALDQFANTMAHTLKISLINSNLFTGTLNVRFVVKLMLPEGEIITMPSKQHAVIPNYALSSDTVRMSSFISGLYALGIQAKFLSWRQFENGSTFF